MLVRLWEARFDPSQRERLETYANQISLPVLSSRRGCEGVLFLVAGDRWITQTFWQDRHSIEALDRDAEYARIVEGILALGVLGPEQTTTVFEFAGGAVQIG